MLKKDSPYVKMTDAAGKLTQQVQRARRQVLGKVCITRLRRG